MARIVVFAFDIQEASQIRRIDSLRRAGHDVVSFGFRRGNMNDGYAPAWPHVDLGKTENARLLHRLGAMGKGLWAAWKARSQLGNRDLWIARNLDLLAVAWALRLIVGKRSRPLVYECLDIHGLMTRAGLVGAVMRWMERRLLGAVSLLILSSPGFERNYFGPVQGYSGKTALIENKIWISQGTIRRPTKRLEVVGPLTLGWVGSLRCADSLALLKGVAEALDGKIKIRCHGNVHRHALPDFDAILDASDNITYAGPYDYPGDLARVYSDCDLVWAQDLWQKGGNSDWLLPNRIYEASFFGCPSVAVEGTETAIRIRDHHLGYTIPAATPEALIGLLSGLSRSAIREVSDGILSRPETEFLLTIDELDQALRDVLPPSGEEPAREIAATPDVV